MSSKLIKESDIQKKKKAENQNSEVVLQILTVVLTIVGCALCLLLPLYLQEGYYHVGESKFNIYKYICIIGYVPVLILWVLYLLLQKEKRSFKELFSVTDWCVLAFILLSFVAALAGGNFSACVWGYNGWYMGIISMISFALLYFSFSRFGRFYQVVLAFLFFTCFIVFGIGVLHRLMIDPIGTYEGIEDTYKNQFLSTMGQATWYSSFVCTVLPLGIYFFWSSKSAATRVVSGIFSFVGFATMVTQNSDSAYVALIGFLAVFFWFSLNSAWGMERLMEVALLFLAATRFMKYALVIHPNPVLVLDSMSSFWLANPLVWWLCLAAVAAWAVFFYLAKKQIYFGRAAKIIRICSFSALGIVVLAAVIVLILSAKGTLPEWLSAFTGRFSYITWSDNWGNGRGRTWAFSVQMFKDMDLGHKLFGVGPDGYAPYAYTLYQDRLAEMWGERTLTNAHNEWMNSLINYGIAGTAAYIGIFVTSIRSFAKAKESKPVLIGFIACIVSYMCHNFFCYQQVCCTPFLFLLIGIGEYIRRKSEGDSAK